jgi:hypothetical protein
MPNFIPTTFIVTDFQRHAMTSLYLQHVRSNTSNWSNWRGFSVLFDAGTNMSEAHVYDIQTGERSFNKTELFVLT